MSLRLLLPAVLAAVILAVAARDSAPSEPLVLDAVPQAAVGAVEGGETFVAVTFDGERLRAYACDGTEREAPTLSIWFEGRWDGTRPLRLAANGSVLEVEPPRPGGRISGTLDGRRFTAAPATGPAGLYDRAEGMDRATWIVLADGARRGAMIPTRPPKCRAVLVTGSGGTQTWVMVC